MSIFASLNIAPLIMFAGWETKVHGLYVGKRQEKKIKSRTRVVQRYNTMLAHK